MQRAVIHWHWEKHTYIQTYIITILLPRAYNLIILFHDTCDNLKLCPRNSYFAEGDYHIYNLRKTDTWRQVSDTIRENITVITGQAADIAK